MSGNIQEQNPFDLLINPSPPATAPAPAPATFIQQPYPPPQQQQQPYYPPPQQYQQQQLDFDNRSYVSAPVQTTRQSSFGVGSNASPTKDSHPETAVVSSGMSVASIGQQSTMTAPVVRTQNSSMVSSRPKSELELAYENPASPLPRPEKVVASGFILTRVSFRTILMKKWKQGYWIQYGPNTMYIFRSVADYQDWLKNPYHAQRERDYLVKLKVDFIADILPQDVREYRMTHTTRKKYGRNKPLYHQFKLERIMEFGPTIAACFASQNESEVEAIRQSMQQCKRNAAAGMGQQHQFDQQYVQQQPPSNGYGAVVPHGHQQQSGYSNYQY